MTMRGDGVDADLVRAAEIGKTLLERNAWLERELERAKERIEEREVRYQALSQECWTHEKTTRKLKSQLRRYMSAEGSTTTLTEETTQPLLRRLKVVMNERAVLQKSVVELTGRCEELEGQVRETKSVVMGYGEKMRRLRDEVKGLEKEKREWSSMPALRWRSGDMGGRMVVSSAPDLRGVKESQGMETVGASMVLLRQEESQRDDADESLMEQVQQLERERDELCRIIEDLQETVSRQEEELLVSRDAVDDGVETLDMIEKVGRNVEKGMQTDPEMEMRWIEGMRERDEIDEMLSGMSTPISISLNSEDWDDVMNSRNLIDDEQGVINNEYRFHQNTPKSPSLRYPSPRPNRSRRMAYSCDGAGGEEIEIYKLYPAALTMSWSEVGGRGWRDEEIKTIFVKNIKEEKTTGCFPNGRLAGWKTRFSSTIQR
ncbi:hypothetical protein BC829DRAFT_489780 [Chytridium lagenaria]|nr:hypothetical protein BC829DRAFT_489780 [Chytridium lagenaria]